MKLFREKLKSSGQMAAMSVYGLVIVNHARVCSWLSEAIGYDPALLVVAGFAVPAIVLILMFKKPAVRFKINPRIRFAGEQPAFLMP